MSRIGGGQPGTTTIGVLHRAGGIVRGLIVAAGGGARPRVVAWREFGPDQADRIDGWLEQNHVDQALGVLPASAIVCRTCTLPNAEPEALAAALRLQAEARMPGTTAPHRLGMAVLPPARGETSRSGLLIAWPLTAAAELPRLARDIEYVADVAALAAILNGARPDEPLLWIDPTDGAVALAVSHAGGAVLRAARGEGASPDAWRQSVGRIIAETALSVNHTGAFTESMVAEATRKLSLLRPGSPALLLPEQSFEALRERIVTDRSDAAWWQEHGVAVGAALARFGSLEPLTHMRLTEPTERPSRWRGIAERLAKPDAALKTVLACLLVFLLGPMLAARVRLALVDMRAGNIEQLEKQVHATNAGLVMYDELKDRSWPMAKILSDLACNTPVGVDVDQVRLRYNEPVQLSGRVRGEGEVTAPEVLNRMQEQLVASRVFKDVLPTWDEGDGHGAYEFTLTAQVDRPFLKPLYSVDLDFGRWTLADRLYGKGKPTDEAPAEKKEVAVVPPIDPPIDAFIQQATGAADETSPDEGAGTAVAVAPTGDETEEPIDIVPLPGTTGGMEMGPPAESLGKAGPGKVPGSANIPDPLTPQEIAAMDVSQAYEAMARIAEARKRGKLDDPTRERLAREFKLVRERHTQLKRQLPKPVEPAEGAQ